MAAFMSLRDVGLFVRSARTDSAVSRLRRRLGTAGALQAMYAERGDPWASADPRYRYQQCKYDTLMGLPPPGRRFAHALDLGCGLGLLSRRPAGRADAVLGIDVVLADVLYYLWPLDAATLKAVALRMARLLAPGGVCLLAGHYFFSADHESRRSRRIHDAFAWSPSFDSLAEHRRPFYLVSLLTAAAP